MKGLDEKRNRSGRKPIRRDLGVQFVVFSETLLFKMRSKLGSKITFLSIFTKGITCDNQTTTGALPDRWSDNFFYDNDQCQGDPFLILRAVFQDSKANNNKSAMRATGCEGTKFTACTKIDPKKSAVGPGGLSQKTTCTADINNEMSWNSSQAYMDLITYKPADKNCESVDQNRQRYLVDGKCRKSGGGWLKPVCENGRGYIYTCKDDKCAESCTKAFDAEFNKCSQSGPGVYKLNCGQSIAAGGNTSKTQNNTNANESVPQHLGLSFAALIMTVATAMLQ